MHLGHQRISLRAELRDTLQLAGPIVLTQVGQMSMGLVDTLVAGHISTTALAGLGLAANAFWTFTGICNGLLLALDTYFSQAVGARDERTLGRYLTQSLWSCALVTLFSALCIAAGYVLYRSLAPPGALRDAFGLYLRNIIWCLPTIYVYFVLQRYWQARRRVVPFTIIIVSANVLNLVACSALGLGKWGLPAFGIRGIAWATVLVRYGMLVAAVVFTLLHFRPLSLRLPRFDWSVQRRILGLGLPAAGHTALEIGAFTIATFVVGVLGAVPLAAHHVSLMMSAFTFMFPLGFSSAAAVRVGTFVGAGQPEHARLAGWLCVAVSVAVMSTFALVYLLLPRFLLGCFTTDPAVINVGARILVIVALFQIADGTQVSTTGALRGLGNTRAAMLANAIGHYPIGLALGLVLCFVCGFGVLGLWTGLATGLVSVALMLLRKWRLMSRDLAHFRPVLARTQPEPVASGPA